MNYKKADFNSILTGVLLNLVSISTVAADVVIGMVEKNGMEIVAVYIQPVTMEPMMHGMGPADIHLEADIHALKDNQHGFAEGDWIPYLGITYTISKVESGWSTTGAFMPMAASDGPHYANNTLTPLPITVFTVTQIKKPVFPSGGNLSIWNGNSSSSVRVKRANTRSL